MGKLADYLKEHNLTEEEAVDLLEVFQKEGRRTYCETMRKAWEQGDYEALFNLIISNHRDKGNVQTFFENHSKNIMEMHLVQPF